VAADDATNENFVAARSAFIAAMKEMGWLQAAL
jgi:hypothetical protein